MEVFLHKVYNFFQCKECSMFCIHEWISRSLYFSRLKLGFEVSFPCIYFFVDIGNLSFPATMIFWNGFFRWGHYFFFNGVFNWGHLTFSFIFLKQGHVLPSPSVNILVVFFRMLISAFISNTNLRLPFILLKCQVQHVSRPFSNF